MEPVRKSQRTSSITARSSRFKNSGQTTESKRKHWVRLQAPQGSFPIGLPCLTKNKRPYQYGHLKGDIYTLYVHFSTVDEASKYAEKWSTTFGACLVEDQHTGNLSWRSGIPPEPRDFPYKLFTATITSKNGYACPNPQVLPPILRGLDFPFFIMRNTKEICVLFETDEKVDLYSDTIYSIQSEIEAGGNVTCTVKELSIEQQPSLRVVLFLEEQKGTSRNLPNSEMQDNAYATLLSLIEEVTLVLDIPSNWCANGKSQSSIFISCMTVCLDLSAPGRMLARERPKLPSSMDNTCAPTLALSVEPPAPIETGHASQATAKQATEWITINIPKIKLEPVLPSLATTYREAVQLRVQEWYSQRGALLPDDFGNILKKYTQLSSDNKLSVLKDIGQLNGCIQSTAMAVSSFGGTTFNFELDQLGTILSIYCLIRALYRSTMVKMSNS